MGAGLRCDARTVRDYLRCALVLHLSEAYAWAELFIPAHCSRAIRNIVSTGFVIAVLAGFAFIAFARAGVVPGMQIYHCGLRKIAW